MRIDREKDSLGRWISIIAIAVAVYTPMIIALNKYKSIKNNDLVECQICGNLFEESESK